MLLEIITVYGKPVINFLEQVVEHLLSKLFETRITLLTALRMANRRTLT
jgi:hypothetical protein